MLFRFGKKDDLPEAQDTVNDLLGQAIDTRVKFIVVVPERDTKPHSVTCSVEHVSRESILLDVSRATALSTGWKGRKVQCFFSIVRLQPNRSETFYNFSATLLDLRRTSKGVLIELSMPRSIEPGQRRKSLRIRPLPSLVLSLSMWQNPELAGMMQEPATVQVLPSIPYPNLLKVGGIRVADISAGGMRLAVQGSALQAQTWLGEEGRRLMHCVLGSVADQPVHEYWFSVTRANVTPAPSLSDDAFIGFEFTHEGKPNKAKGLDWLPVKDGHVHRLSRWTNAVYMQYIRKVATD